MVRRRGIVTGLVVVAFLLVAQAFRAPRGNPPVESDVPASPEVRALLRRACYDCHSNETAWPWYARLAPASWIVVHDVERGRASVNFSTWAAYDAVKRSKMLRESATEIGEGEMPPWYYRLIHPEARLTAEDEAVLRAWALGDTAQR